MAEDSWAKANSLADLGELAARFLEGDLDSFPGWGCSTIDAETDAIVEVLALCCRSGFLTVASQPAGEARAGADGRPERRRAFVAGFANAAALACLRSIQSDSLRVEASPARSRTGAPGMVVGERGGEPFLFSGAGAGPEELLIFAEHCSQGALLELERAHFVSIVDETWQRDTVLFKALDQAFAGPPPLRCR